MLSLAQWVLLVLAVVLVAVAALNLKKLIATWAGVREFGGEVVSEMRRVNWPSKDHIIGSTLLVAIATIALGVIIMFVDKIFGALVGLIFTS